MNKSIEATGKTEDEAIASALKELGLERDEVSVEILERAKSGFLGIGAIPARVKVSYSYEETKCERITAFLQGLFKHMDVEADFEISEKEDGTIEVNLTGEHIGTVIGRRGETLDAVQHLANYSLNHGGGERTRINIDAENYRQKREEALQRLAVKVATKVVKYRRNVTLEPMNAYERHVIHTALQEHKGVTTYSTGSEPSRRVVVAYEKQPRQSSHQFASYQEQPQEEQQPQTQPQYITREWS